MIYQIEYQIIETQNMGNYYFILFVSKEISIVKIFQFRVFLNFKNILTYLFVAKFLVSINPTFGDPTPLVEVIE